MEFGISHGDLYGNICVFWWGAPRF
jgi:hypothetical protein